MKAMLSNPEYSKLLEPVSQSEGVDIINRAAIAQADDLIEKLSK